MEWTLSHRPLSSSFLGLPYRININHKKELLRGLWVTPSSRPRAGLRKPGPVKAGGVVLCEADAVGFLGLFVAEGGEVSLHPNR